MSTFVLVHGAWQTASTWDVVASRLRDAGHSVVVPMLTGLENDANVLSPDISLSTHIQNVADMLDSENLRHVILVGHSYAGMIISGVAERALACLDRLVYVDAFVQADGQSALDLLPPPIAEMFRQNAARDGNGWMLPGGEAQLDLWGLKPGPERDFVRSNLSDFTLHCFQEAVRLATNAPSKINRTFIACTGDGYPARPVFQQFGDRAKREGWTYYELPTGHDCYAEMPDAFVSILLSQAVTP